MLSLCIKKNTRTAITMEAEEAASTIYAIPCVRI
jgi:hypothetical protein